MLKEQIKKFNSKEEIQKILGIFNSLIKLDESDIKLWNTENSKVLAVRNKITDLKLTPKNSWLEQVKIILDMYNNRFKEWELEKLRETAIRSVEQYNVKVQEKMKTNRLSSRRWSEMWVNNVKKINASTSRDFTDSYFGGLSLVQNHEIYFVDDREKTKLEVENSFINYFDKETEIYKGMKKIDDDLGGTTPLSIILKFPIKQTESGEEDEFSEWEEENESEENKAKYWFTRDKMDKIIKVHDYLDSLPEIGKVLSFGSILRVAEDLNNKELQSLEIHC